ncbi:hypothetical protein AAE478_007709 [Parahypoxylon ruwenzoriense]
MVCGTRDEGLQGKPGLAPLICLPAKASADIQHPNYCNPKCPLAGLPPQLSHNGQLKVVALATLTNFDKPLGPSVRTAWTLLPPPKPTPDFDRVLANEPEDN